MLMPIFTVVRANFQKFESDNSRNSLATILYPLSTLTPQRMKLRDVADFHVSSLVCSTAEGKGNPLQYSCLGNSMDRGACGLVASSPLAQTRAGLAGGAEGLLLA